MKFIKKVKKYLENENYIWEHNSAEIEEINQKILILLASIFGVGAFMLSIIATFKESFYLLKIPYYMLFLTFIPIFLLASAKKKRVSSLTLLYLTYIIMMMFTAYGGAIVVPDALSTLILGFVFVFSLTIFDKSIRVTCTMIGFVFFYLIVVTPLKSPDIVYMDSVNVIGFSVVATVLGSYLRQLQLENIDLRRQSKIRESTDALTGLLNRATLLETENNEQTLDHVEAVVMIDIDFF